MQEAPLDVRLLGKEIFYSWSSQQPGAGLWSQSQGLAVARIAWELWDHSQGEWCRSQTYRDNERELGD